MLETKNSKVPDLSCLEKLDKETLREVSGNLKEQGAIEIAQAIDVAVSHITAEEVKSGTVPVYSEADFKKRYSKYNK